MEYHKNVEHLNNLCNTLAGADARLDQVDNDFIESLNPELRKQMTYLSLSITNSIDYLNTVINELINNRQELFKMNLSRYYKEEIIQDYIDDTDGEDFGYWLCKDFRQLLDDFETYVHEQI